MTGAARIFLALAAFGLCVAAQEPESDAPPPPAQSVEGYYVVDLHETASGLELTPDGRFRWMFTTGALDLVAEGRWRRDGNDVLLDTEPIVEPPRFEFLGAGREEAPALVVRVEDPSGQTPVYLDAEAEYDSGAPAYARLDEDAYRFEPAPGRRIIAIRVGSAGFRFWSERYPVPADANSMRFRFFPGDLGRADFRGERATVEAGILTLAVLGQPVQYRRLTAEENAELQTALAAIAADIAAAEGDEGATAAPADISEEDELNWAHCVNDGLQFPRSVAIAGCTGLIESGRLAPADAATPYYNRGNLLVDDRDYARAIADYDEAIRLNPGHAMAYWGRGSAYAGLFDFARAVVDSRAAARLDPENPDILNYLCWHLALAREDLEGARSACDASLRLRAGDADTLDSRGMVGLRQERFEEAWQDYDAAAQAVPGNAGFVYGRGIAALRLGRTAEGEADLARATEIDPAIAATYARYGIEP